MEYELEMVKDVSVIRIREKKLTSHEAPQLKTALLAVVVEHGEKILINMAEVSALDSTGLGALLFGVRQAEQHEKDMRFCCAGEKVKNLVRIAHLESVMDVYANEAAAIQAFEADYE